MSILEDLHAVEDRIVARLQELEPVVAEYRELCGAAERLGIDVSQIGCDVAAPPASRRAAAAQRPGGTRATGAERRARVLEMIGAHPSITVADLSEALDVQPSPLYRVVRHLLAEGAIVKHGTRLHLA